MARLAPLQQAGMDGLCGIYCLLNFIRSNAQAQHRSLGSSLYERDRQVFLLLLRSAQQLNILTADTVYAGFEWYQLRDVFALTCKNMQAPFVAVPLNDVASQLQSESPFFVIAELANDGGCALVNMTKKDHWVLAFSAEENSILVDDSSEAEIAYEITRSEINRTYGLTLDQGLALIPTDSRFAAWNN